MSFINVKDYMSRRGKFYLNYDFAGSVIDDGKWAYTSGITQNELIQAVGGGDWSRGIISKAFFKRSQNLILEFDLKCTVAGGYIMIGWHENNITNFNYTNNPHYIYLPWGLNIQVVQAAGGGYDTGVAWTNGVQYRFRIILREAGGADYYYSTNGGDTWTRLGLGTILGTNSIVRFGCSVYATTWEIDNVRIYQPADKPFDPQTPVSMTDYGKKSQFSFDNNYLYVAYTNNLWKRVLLSGF